MYRIHRNTQDTLSVIESLDLDDTPCNEEELAVKFGWHSEWSTGRLTAWHRVKPRLWAIVDDPGSSGMARVIGYIHSHIHTCTHRPST